MNTRDVSRGARWPRSPLKSWTVVSAAWGRGRPRAPCWHPGGVVRTALPTCRDGVPASDPCRTDRDAPWQSPGLHTASLGACGVSWLLFSGSPAKSANWVTLSLPPRPSRPRAHRLQLPAASAHWAGPPATAPRHRPPEGPNSDGGAESCSAQGLVRLSLLIAALFWGAEVHFSKASSFF